MSSYGVAHIEGSRRTFSGLVGWLLVRDRIDRGWADSLANADLDWLLAATERRSTTLSAQAAALVGPLGVGAAALAASVKAGVPAWISVPTLLCLSISGACLVLSIGRVRSPLETLAVPLKRSELLKDEAATVHEKARLLRRAIVWLLLGAIGVIASAVIAIE